MSRFELGWTGGLLKPGFVFWLEWDLRTNRIDVKKTARKLANPHTTKTPLCGGHLPTISASFFTTLFPLAPHCHACRSRNLGRGLRLPGFEPGLAESRVIARNQCSLAELRS